MKRFFLDPSFSVLDVIVSGAIFKLAAAQSLWWLFAIIPWMAISEAMDRNANRR